jgi:hypothetical protein
MIRSRQVFFIGGYDPKGGSRVYTDLREELLRDTQLHGRAWQISPRERQAQGHEVWTLQDNSGVQTRFELLRWDHLVRAQWARTPLALAREALEWLLRCAMNGSLLHIFRRSRPLVYAALMPFGLALATLLGPLLLGLWLAWLLPVWQALGIAGIGVWLGYRVLRTTPTTWFLRAAAFSLRYSRESRRQLDSHALPAQVYQRQLHAWAARLTQDLANSEAEEILFVGYSAGSILATGLLAQLLPLLPQPQRERLSLLTLGNCIPVSACQSSAQQMRSDLRTLAQYDLSWVDITSPIDWGSLYGIDSPSLYAGTVPSVRRRALSPRFHTLFEPPDYEALKRNKYRVHQQYLRTTPLLPSEPGTYDYLGLIGGPQSLAERYLST